MDRKTKKTREEWNSSRRKQRTENIKEGEEGKHVRDRLTGKF